MHVFLVIDFSWFTDRFRCKSGQCISSVLKCDGDHDCADGSDEDRALCSSTTCSSDNFRCNNSRYTVIYPIVRIAIYGYCNRDNTVKPSSIHSQTANQGNVTDLKNIQVCCGIKR